MLLLSGSDVESAVRTETTRLRQQRLLEVRTQERLRAAQVRQDFLEASERRKADLRCAAEKGGRRQRQLQEQHAVGTKLLQSAQQAGMAHAVACEVRSEQRAEAEASIQQWGASLRRQEFRGTEALRVMNETEAAKADAAVAIASRRAQVAGVEASRSATQVERQRAAEEAAQLTAASEAARAAATAAAIRKGGKQCRVRVDFAQSRLHGMAAANCASGHSEYTEATVERHAPFVVAAQPSTVDWASVRGPGIPPRAAEQAVIAATRSRDQSAQQLQTAREGLLTARERGRQALNCTRLGRAGDVLAVELQRLDAVERARKSVSFRRRPGISSATDKRPSAREMAGREQMFKESCRTAVFEKVFALADGSCTTSSPAGSGNELQHTCSVAEITCGDESRTSMACVRRTAWKPEGSGDGPCNMVNQSAESASFIPS
jgi:hypothetical protein